MSSDTTTETMEGSRSSARQKSSNTRSRTSVILWTTYVNTFLYALCYQLQRPVEPFLVQQLSANADDAESVAKTYAYLQSFFSVIQTIGSPLVGILLDRIGIRKASVIVFLASACSYAILAGASDMNLLFYSKIPTALQHAFLVAQAAASSSTYGDGMARAQALGRMTTSYTLGATVGPYLGGQLAERGDLYLGAKLAVLGSLLSVLLSIVFLPDGSNRDNMDKRKAVLESHSTGKSDLTKNSIRDCPPHFLQEVRQSLQLMFRAFLWPLLTVKVIGGVAASIHQTALPLVLTQRLKFDPADLGVTMSSSMFSIAAFGAVGFAPLVKMLGLPMVTKGGLCARSILGLALAVVVSGKVLLSSSSYENGSFLKHQVIVTNMLHGLASHALATGLTTQTTGAVQPEEQGSLLGLEHGLFSLARVAAPPIGSWLLSTGENGFWTVETVCAAIDWVLLGLLVATAAAAVSKATTTSEAVESKTFMNRESEALPTHIA